MARWISDLDIHMPCHTHNLPYTQATPTTYTLHSNHTLCHVPVGSNHQATHIVRSAGSFVSLLVTSGPFLDFGGVQFSLGRVHSWSTLGRGKSCRNPLHSPRGGGANHLFMPFNTSGVQNYSPLHGGRNTSKQCTLCCCVSCHHT